MKTIIATFIFFTRLPFGKIKNIDIPSQSFKEVLNYWSLVGWLTGGIMVLVLYLSSFVFDKSISILLCLLSRIIITGALHEDGLADFFDGFGGSKNKEKTLSIMKDSHIGTYGVLSLIFYFFLLFYSINSLDLSTACFILLAADPFCKFISSTINIFLPYARKEEESKAKIIYKKPSLKSLTISVFFAIIPFILLPIKYLIAIVFPIIVFLFLLLLMRKRINGYTGDCCGASFLLCELSFIIGITIIQ